MKIQRLAMTRLSLSPSEPLLHHWQLPPARPGAKLAGRGPLFQDGEPQAGAVRFRRVRIHKGADGGYRRGEETQTHSEEGEVALRHRGLRCAQLCR